MMRPRRTLKNQILISVLATVLVLCCVLAIVPAQLFANWVMFDNTADTAPEATGNG